VRNSIETWVGWNGTTRMRTIQLSYRFASAHDRRAWLAGHAGPPPVTDSDWIGAGDGRFDPDDAFGISIGPRALARLPVTTAKLELALARLIARQQSAQQALYQPSASALKGIEIIVQAARHHRVCAHHHCQLVIPLPPSVAQYSASQEAGAQQLQAVQTLLTFPLSKAQRRAVLHVASTTQGVVFRADVRDPLGRVADRIEAPASGQWIDVAPSSGEILATGYATSDLGYGPSTIVTVARGIVDSLSSVPHGVEPPSEPAGLRPLEVAISPSSGGPHSSFRVRVTVFDGRSSRPIDFLAELFGPCGVNNAAILAVRPDYILRPHAARIKEWCAGTYYLDANGAGPTALNGGASGSATFQINDH
jgi:hypothetical protein